LPVPERGSVLSRMEVAAERKDYLASLSPDDRAVLIPYLTPEQVVDLASHFTVDDHLARLRLCPPGERHKYLRSLTTGMQRTIMIEKWDDALRREYLDALRLQDCAHRLGELPEEQCVAYLRHASVERVLALLALHSTAGYDDADVERWMLEARATLTEKVDELDPGTQHTMLENAGSLVDKASLLGSMNEGSVNSYLAGKTLAEKLALLEAMQLQCKDAKMAYLDHLLDEDRELLMALLAQMSDAERRAFFMEIDDAEELAELLEEMDPATRIVCLRQLPIPLQVEILRSFDEEHVTAYMRFLGDQWPEERKAVGRAMMNAMTEEERRAAWAQRKTIGEVTLEQGQSIDGTALDEYLEDLDGT